LKWFQRKVGVSFLIQMISTCLNDAYRGWGRGSEFCALTPYDL
jgi:hypothetical protein